MNTRVIFSVIPKILCVSLLVLTGILPGDLRTLAQAQEACPLPTGVTAPPEPRVTAQQVEEGSASLKDFALALRDLNLGLGQSVTSAEEIAHLGCLVRQEGSAWRSGSTFLVQLTPDARVLVHAKDMSLSGRQLKPSIYGAVLGALGINPADLADPAAAQAALVAATARDGGSFDVADIPGASGYAVMYLSASFRLPLLMLVGFDLNASHLANEDIRFARPSVTASDVVNRKTLKEFVTQAGEFVLALQQTGDLAASSKARIALRDPTGPWRHGSVYLYVLDTVSNVVLFHATQPDLLELQPLVGIARDGRTGELILPQVLAAARSSPEGGFIEYYYDDPADDTDNADIPKVGYAREFSGQVPRPDGTMISVRYVVGSGFYRSSPNVVAAGRNEVVESVLPQVMRAMTAGTVDAISGRVRQAASGAGPGDTASLGGASTLSGALMANRAALENGTFEPERLLADSSFVLPLAAAGEGMGGLFEQPAFWGSGDYRSISGGSQGNVVYDGDVTSGTIGIDTRLGGNLLAGLSVGQAYGKVDYTDPNELAGTLTTTLTNLNPYVGWQMAGGMSLWATAGYGAGEVEIEDANGTEVSDLTQHMVAAGASGPLVSSDRLIEGGTTQLVLNGEAAFTKAEVEGAGTLRNMSLSASRQRLTLEGSHAHRLASGATLAPSIEIGMRNDAGDGETGNGIEAGGGLRYADTASGLTIEGRARTLLVHSDEYEEWSVTGLARIDPGASGRGLSLSVRPAWGEASSGIRQLVETAAAGGAAPAYQASGRLDAEVGYGLGVAPGMGVMTPYAGLGLTGEGGQSWRAGTRWDVAPGGTVSLEGAWREAGSQFDTESSLMLRGALNW